MVYLREIIKSNALKLTAVRNIELIAYLSISCPDKLNDFEYELSPEEQIAFQGYKKETVERNKINAIISKPPIKGMDATSNIYKFAGLYLSSPDVLKKLVFNKYLSGDLKQKYFLSRIEPLYKEHLRKDILSSPVSPVEVLISKIIEARDVSEIELNSALKEFLCNDIDVQAQLLLEDLEGALLKMKFVNKDAEEIIRDVCYNFNNSIQKIIKNRRKGHLDFKINDEYDVQDILYVILKCIFPNLRDEDAIPKVGAKSTKIDLILREEQILIEVKMIKEKDLNEVGFIEELKIDFESYHECKWLKKLFCFVYDPYRKTRDISNFIDLNGSRIKGGHSFHVELIVAS